MVLIAYMLHVATYEANWLEGIIYNASYVVTDMYYSLLLLMYVTI